MSYLYAVTSQRPTATNFSVVCNFTSPTDRNLVLARGNYLEIHVLREHGLTPVLDVPMFGRIKALDFYRPVNSTQDLIFVLIERKKFCVLAYDAAKNELVTKSIGNVKDRIGRDIEMGQRAFLDPDSRMIGMMLYDGLIKVVPIDSSGLKDSFNLTLEETRVFDIKFLHGCAKPTVAMLYEDNRRARHVKTYCIDSREKEFTAGPWHQNNVEFGANLLIPVPAPLNGVLVVGLTTISYISGTGNIQAIEMSASQICAYTKLDAYGTRYLLADHRGQLMVVSLTVEHNKVLGVMTDILGTTSIAETLNYLDNGVVFVGSCLGDSQLVKLHTPQTAPDGQQVEILDSYTNIGPVLDMCIVDNDKNGGQKQIVTCSGAYKDGSLRIVRSGIGIHEQASLEISGIKAIWSLRPSADSEFDKYLVQSFLSETRILAMEGEELNEIEIAGFSNQQASIFCGNMANNLLVQVTASGVRLVDSETHALLQELAMQKNVTVARANQTQLVVAQSGGVLTYYQLNADNRRLQEVKTVQLDQDIACLSMSATNGGDTNHGGSAMEVEAPPSAEQPAHLLAVGMWTDNTVRLLTLPSLEEVSRVKLGTETQARDVAIASFTSKDYVFVGMGDGSLITYLLETTAEQGLPQLTNRKKGVLGRHPVSFTSFRSNDELCIFAACDRPTIIYLRNGKLLFANVDLRNSNAEIIDMTAFHSELFPDCLALCSEQGLMIGTIEDIQKIHVQTVPLGEAPRRIAHDPRSGVYIVCTEKIVATERGEETVNRVLFFDDGDMSQIASYDLEYLEQAISATVCEFQNVENKSYFVVGTGQLVNEELEPSRGRVMIFEVTEDRRCVLVAEKETKAAVFTLANIDGKLAAGIGSKVQIFKFLVKEEGSLHVELQNECSHQGHIVVLFLKVHGDLLLVGDVVRSVTLLKYRGTESVLEEVARDFNTNYMRAIEVMDSMDDHFLGCDDQANLFCVRRRLEASSEEQQSKLELRGEYHLGDYVNVMRRGNLVSQPIDVEVAAPSSSSASANSSAVSAGGDIFDPDYKTVTGFPLDKYSVMYATISGAIGNIFAMNEASYRFFHAIEKAAKDVIKPVGNFPHDEWRNFHNNMRSSEQKNIVDGDLVERILDLSKDQLDLVARKVNDILGQLLASDAQEIASKPSTSTESASALLNNLANSRVSFTAEEIIRRVEDMSRLH